MKVSEAEDKLLCVEANRRKVGVPRLLAETALGRADATTDESPKTTITELMGIRRILTRLSAGQPVGLSVPDLHRTIDDTISRIRDCYGTDR